MNLVKKIAKSIGSVLVAGLGGGPGGAGGGPSGDGLLLETGSDYLLLETGDYLLLE